MSLGEVVAALNAAITPAKRIDLLAAANDYPALTALGPLLTRLRISGSFVVNNAVQTPAATSATLTGSASWGLPSAPAANICAVTVRLDAVATAGDGVTFTLALTIAQAGWTFGTTFAGLPQTMMIQDMAVLPSASFLRTIRLDNAAFTARSDRPALILSGSLPSAPFWDPWKALVKPWPLQLSGDVTLPARYDAVPLLDLAAVAAAARIPLHNALLDLQSLALGDVGFGLISRPAETVSSEPEPAFSQLNLVGWLRQGPLYLRLSCPLLATGKIWHFSVEFLEGGDVVGSLDQLAQLFGLPSLPTPPDFLPVGGGFRFQSIELYIEPGTAFGDFTIHNIAVSIVALAGTPWRSPMPFISVQDVGISWLWGATRIDGRSTGWLASTVFGTLVFGTDQSVHIDAAVTIPDWSAIADLRNGDVIPIGQAFSAYFGSAGPPTESDMNITGLGIQADPQEQSYYAYADIVFGTPPKPRLVTIEDGSMMLLDDDVTEQGWTIPLVVTSITLTQLNFSVSLIAGELSGGIAGTFLFGQGTGVEPAAFILSANYPGPALTHPEGWTFAGSLLPGASIDLTALVGRFLGQTTVPPWVPHLNVDRLYFRFNTGTPKAYAFGGTVSLRWQPEIFGTTVRISAAVALDMEKRGSSDTASGKLHLAFAINRLELSAGLTLGVPEPIYDFEVKFGDGAFRGVTSWRGEGAARHQVITLQLAGVTVGSILEYLVNLAAPTIGYSLDPPWDILNSIDLSRFTLTLDPQESVVELVYAANADLVFMRLDTIGIRYTRGQKSGVSLILTGSMLGKRFDGDDLAWDVIDGSPPALPGQGSRFIRLRYLGLGQRVALTRVPDTVAETLALLETELKEPTAGQNPIVGQGVSWSSASQWLIGLDIGLLDTIDLGIIFNDPLLYGLSVALGGEKAGSLAGLRFEILYKKISDTIGMFRIELTLPEAFRTFEFGEVSVTLGTVVIEIYTNGNFKIDLGFPYNRDFSRSFTVQVFPFIGRGGLYFGLLNGTTSRRVPRVSNGNFAPVIELGVGLAVGVGKEIHIGPLSGGIYVQVEVIFEGVIGWFHTSAAGGDTTPYYRAQGVAAIHGKLYGSVDFKVIKVSVSLDAYAAATVTLEAYRPTVFRLEVSVSAEAEITILFVSVSFSFDIDLDVSFQIGDERSTPWLLSSDQSDVVHAPAAATLAHGADSAELRAGRAKPSRAVRSGLPAPRRRPARRLALLATERAARMAATASVRQPNWQPTKTVFTNTPRTAALTMLPAFGVADVPLAWTATLSTPTTPRYRFAMQLFAPTGVTADARTAAQTHQRSAALSPRAADDDDLDALAADVLVQGLLLYSIYAIPHGPQSSQDTVYAGDLAWLAGVMEDPDRIGDGFNEGSLKSFFDTNIHWSIAGVPVGVEAATGHGSMAVAIPPVLSWTSPQTGAVDFATDNKVGPGYVWGVQAAAAAFSPSGTPPPGPPPDPLADYVSFASHLFSDWALMIARSAVREAAAALDDRVLPAATSAQTLAAIAHGQPTASVTHAVRPGESVATVADALGATIEELKFLNDRPNDPLADRLKATPAGGTIAITLGVSPGMLAIDNPAAALRKSGLSLGTLSVAVTATDTLNALAKRYGTTAAAIMGFTGQDADAKLLAPAATFDAPAVPWTAAPAGFTVVRAAAAFYIRYAGVPIGADTGADAASWYAQSLATLNATALHGVAIDPRTRELPPGVALAIPAAYLDATPIANGYTTIPGDTLARIGAMLDLVQNEATITGTTAWPAFRDGTTAVTGGYAIPAFTGVAIAPGETLASLARRTIVNWVVSTATPPVWSANWTGLAAWVGTARILAPLTLVTVPGVTTDTTTSYTFATLAAAYGLALDDLAGRVATVAGLVEGTALKVRHLPADTVQSLLDRVSAKSISGIASESSRFLLSGQDIPVPVATTGGHVAASTIAVSPLFDQSRQQWDLTIDATAPTTVALSLTVTSQVTWISFAATAVMTAETDTTTLAALNPALAAGRVLPGGAIVRTADTTTLSFAVTNQQVIDAMPATTLAWPPYRPLAAVAVRGRAPVTYGLGQHIALQSAVALPIAGFDPASTTLSLHPFPAGLLARARVVVPGAPKLIGYDVLAGVPDTATDSSVTGWTFATVIAFTVRRLADAPGVYQLVGAAVEQLPLLLDLIGYLGSTAAPAGTVARIAMPPSTTAADPSGIAIVDGDAWLLKTNLSTETVPPSLGSQALDDPVAVYRADLSSPADFALLLWEGSVVGGVGYSLGMTGGIAEGAFDASDQATLQLVVIAGARQGTTPATGRTLLPFDTAAIAIDQGIPDGATLFAEAHASTDPAEYISQALVPAGTTGLTLTLTRPQATTGQNGLRQAYSLLTATAATSTGFPYTIPPSGLPAAPQASDGSALDSVDRARARRRGIVADPAPKPYWSYQVVLPVARFGPASLAPAVDGLPPPAADPYRGLGGATAAPKVDFRIGFGDVYGNRTAAADNAPITVPVGYTDPLRGPSSWPATALSYGVSKTGSTVTLAVTLAAKAQSLMPDANQRGDALVEAAKRQRDDYAAIYYQYVQRGLLVTTETSLQMSGTGPAALTLAGAAGLRAFAGGGYATAASATGFAAVHPTTATLDAIVTGYGIGWEALAAVNADVTLWSIFGTSVAITVPGYVVMASGDSATSIAAVARPGWPAPTASALLGLTPNTALLPLKIGAVLSYTPRGITLPTASPTLAGAATAASSSAGWLAADSAADPILISGFVFTVDGVSVSAGSAVPSFAAAVDAFAALGIQLTAYDLGAAHADTTAMLKPGAAAHVAHFVVAGHATLASNTSGATTADLIVSNLTTPDLYDAGALIYLGDFGTGSPARVTPGETDTLAAFAAGYACPPAALLYANKAMTVVTKTALAIPGAVSLPPSTDIAIPYTIRASDDLAGIAARFDLVATPDKATALAERNRMLPGTVAQGLSFDVTVGGSAIPIDTTGLTSFAAVLDTVRVTAPAATMTDVAAAFSVAGRLAEGGLLLCPPASLAAAASPSAIPTAYGIGATAFALANAGITGLIASNITLTLTTPPATLTTTSSDTLNSIVARFNAGYLAAGKRATATLSGIIAANADAALFAAGARAMLPPADIVLTTPLAANGPYPSAAFALTVTLVVARPAALVHPDFVGTPVATVRGLVAAPATAALPGGSMTLDAFRGAFITALPNLRLATAKLPEQQADLWAVDFGTSGITSVTLDRGVSFGTTKIARMIALAPLYGRLVSRTRVPVTRLVAGKLDPTTTIQQDYQGIDVEVWAARFLADFDRLLGPASAAAIDAIVALRPQFARLMSAKARLQAAIPQDLASVFAVNPASGPQIPRAVTDPHLASGLTEARRVFGEALGISLSSAWSTAAIVQYDAAVDSRWTRAGDLGAGRAALYGEARSKTLTEPVPDPTVATEPATRPWRLAAGKVSLSDTAPFLTLPLTVSDPASQSQVALDLVYATTNVELNRSVVLLAPGYSRSDWLMMTPPLDTAGTVPAALKVDLGRADVPIPLKAFPALPLVLSQSGHGDETIPPALATAALWSFAATYAHEHAAQDHVRITAEFNLTRPDDLALADTPDQDLFTALAQYVAVADTLNAALAGLTDPAGKTATTTIAAAIETFADLALVVAGLWATRLTSEQSAMLAEGVGDWIASERHPFAATVSYQPGTKVMTGYTLTREAGSIGPELAWPAVECQSPTGEMVSLVVTATGAAARTYAPPGGTMPLSGWPHFRLTWPGLNLGTTQNARITLDVTRNADLTGASGPATANAFVYRTATVTATDIVTPGIARTAPLAMSGAKLATAIQSAFDALFPPAGRRSDLRMTLGLFYGYTLVPGDDPLVSELAVGMLPDTILDSATATAVADAFTLWRDRVKPATAGGLWTMSLTLYSSLDPGKRVLLSLDRLTYPLIGNAIDDEAKMLV